MPPTPIEELRETIQAVNVIWDKIRLHKDLIWCRKEFASLDKWIPLLQTMSLPYLEQVLNEEGISGLLHLDARWWDVLDIIEEDFSTMWSTPTERLQNLYGALQSALAEIDKWVGQVLFLIPYTIEDIRQILAAQNVHICRYLVRIIPPLPHIIQALLPELWALTEKPVPLDHLLIKLGESIIPELVKKLVGHDIVYHIWSVTETLIRFQETSLPYLLQAAENGSYQALYLLWHFNNFAEQILPVVETSLASDDPQMRQSALRVLFSEGFGNLPEGMRLIRWVLQEEHLREEAFMEFRAGSTGHISNEESALLTPILMAATQDPNPELARDAIQLLGWYGNRTHIDFLLDIFYHAPLAGHRSAAAGAMAMLSTGEGFVIEDERVIHALLTNLDFPDDWDLYHWIDSFRRLPEPNEAVALALLDLLRRTEFATVVDDIVSIFFLWHNYFPLMVSAIREKFYQHEDFQMVILRANIDWIPQVQPLLEEFLRNSTVDIDEYRRRHNINLHFGTLE